MSRMTCTPLLIGPGNAQSAIGASWRWVRDVAKQLGVRFVGHGRKRFVIASEFISAISSALSATADLAMAAVTPVDPAEQVRQALGLRHRTPSPGTPAAIEPDPVDGNPCCPMARPTEAA